MMMPNLAVNLPLKAFKLIDSGCPACGATAGGRNELQYHSLSIWCLRCGWSANWQAILQRISNDGKLDGDVHSGLADKP